MYIWRVYTNTCVLYILYIQMYLHTCVHPTGTSTYVHLHMVFTYWDKSSILHHSFQLLSGSHWDGFGWGLSSPIPPVSRNLQSSSLTSFLCFIRFTHNMKEKRSCREGENTQWHMCYVQVGYVCMYMYNTYVCMHVRKHISKSCNLV